MAGFQVSINGRIWVSTEVVWKLDRLGRDLAHLVAVVSDLADREIGLQVLSGQGAAIDTGTASGRQKSINRSRPEVDGVA